MLKEELLRIERAVGFLMATHRTSAVEAFNLLHRLAREQRRPVAEVATRVLEPSRNGRVHPARPTDGAVVDRVAVEHEIAEALQTALLPGVDRDPPGLRVAAYYRAGVAGTRVGGDWYDLIPLPGGRTGLVIGDVMGRGVRAAALMGQVRSAVRAYARLALSPAQLLGCCDGLVADLASGVIVTCVYAVHDPSGPDLVWAGAGHLPPLLITAAGAVEVLEQRGSPPLGTRSVRPVEQHLTLSVDDTFVLYTDGLVECRDRALEPGIARLGRLLCRWDGGELAALVDQLQHHTEDDVALLTARVLGTAGSETPGAAARRRKLSGTATGDGIRRTVAPDPGRRRSA